MQAAGYAGGPEMTLIEHLKELRNRVIVSAITLTLTTIFCFVFYNWILEVLLQPARDYDENFELYSFTPTDRIGLVIKIGLYGGLLLASPMFVYQALAFIVPGLTPKETKLLLPGLALTVVFMLMGMAFAYWVVLPASLNFLLNIGGGNIRTATGAVAYVSFVIRIVFWVGVSFELPVVLGLAAKLGLVRARQLLRFWRYAFLIIVIIAAIITPTPDPYNQLLVAGPLFVLYFVGVVFAWIVQPSRAVQSPA